MEGSDRGLISRGTIPGKINYSRIIPPIRARSKADIQQELISLRNSIKCIPSRSKNILSSSRRKVIELDTIREHSEEWSQRRNLAVSEFRSDDRRKLRKFFNTLDDDKSGEVSFQELLDPLVSSGMYRSTQDVIRLLSSLDSNQSNGIDFDEFMIAMTHHRFGNKKELRKLVQCTSDPLGFHIDTLLSAERRKKLKALVIRRKPFQSESEDEKILEDLLCNEEIMALEVLVKMQKAKYASSTNRSK